MKDTYTEVKELIKKETKRASRLSKDLMNIDVTFDIDRKGNAHSRIRAQIGRRHMVAKVMDPSLKSSIKQAFTKLKGQIGRVKKSTRRKVQLNFSGA